MSNQFKNLVFEGGGVKGVAYVGAIEVLDMRNMLGGVQSVAGTSAGAITATLLALGYSSTQIKAAVLEMDFRKFEDGFNPFRLFSSYGLYRGKVFLQWIKQKIKEAGLPADVTFSGMASSHHYRELKVFATDLYTHSIQEFSFDKTPDCIVAEAVRASMSIPLFFKSWTFSNHQPNDHIYVDGGVLYNYPLDIYKNLDETLGFYLTNLKLSPQISTFGLFSPIQYIRNLFDTLLMAQNIAFDENRLERQQSVLINDLGVSATDFKLSRQTKLKLVHQGKVATEKYFQAS